jgi:hypothetical protein
MDGITYLPSYISYYCRLVDIDTYGSQDRETQSRDPKHDRTSSKELGPTSFTSRTNREVLLKILHENVHV